MKKILFFLFTLISSSALAAGNHDHGKAETGYTAKLVSTDTKVTFSLTKPDGKPASFADLKTVHTQKLHALIIDPSLVDYHHVHPQPTDKDGEFSFDFTPTKSSNYKVWLDITPEKSEHQYITLDLPGKSDEKEEIQKTEITKGTAKIGDKTYNFELKFDNKIIDGEMVMGKISVTDEAGKPANNLEPVMGAFAHIVGFADDYQTIAHLHPMGKEPEAETERGGPELEFHLSPGKAGFLKLFGQFKIDGQQVFLPFGVIVQSKNYLSYNF